MVVKEGRPRAHQVLLAQWVLQVVVKKGRARTRQVMVARWVLQEGEVMVEVAEIIMVGVAETRNHPKMAPSHALQFQMAVVLTTKSGPEMLGFA